MCFPDFSTFTQSQGKHIQTKQEKKKTNQDALFFDNMRCVGRLFFGTMRLRALCLFVGVASTQKPATPALPMPRGLPRQH